MEAPDRPGGTDQHDRPVRCLSGALDLTAAPPLQQALADELSQPDLTGLTIDMSAVTFIDSTVLSTLVFAHHTAHEAGRQLTISPSRMVQRKLELTGLTALVAPRTP